MPFNQAVTFILMENVSNTMDEGVIKEALKAHKDIAAWGANGPDLGLIQVGELFGYSPWSCNFHYFKTGDFCKTMLEKALESGDLKKIAFAAGWVTHCCGDMGCHGIFVNPEAGVYLDEPEGRPLHMALEKNAEPVLWVEKGAIRQKITRKPVLQLDFQAHRPCLLIYWQRRVKRFMEADHLTQK